MKVLVSPFKNPFINLALEDHFLRGGADLPLLFFYENRPSVVLGRFQNPWLECDLPFIAQNNIWMVRRQSGGGCVYHDDGNINYSFIWPTGMIDRNKGVELIQKAFRRAAIELTISARHDLWLDGRKISGSAFKQIKEASFHHGTFLVSSDLQVLEKCLKSKVSAQNSKAIPSVRSHVTKLQNLWPDFALEDVIELIAHECQAPTEEIDYSILNLHGVQSAFKSLTSWEWLWGETPAFELDELHIHKGLVKSPFEARFDLENMKGKWPESKLETVFPDFTKQEVGQNLIF